MGLTVSCLFLGQIAARGDALWVAIALMVGGLCGGLAGNQPVVLAVTCLVVILGSTFDESVSSSMFYPRFVMYGGLMAASIGNRARFTRGLDATALGLFAFAGLTLLSTTWSIDRTLTVSRSTSFILLSTAMFVLATYRWKSAATLRRDLVYVATVGSAVVISCGLVYLWSPGWAYSATRFRGLLENPNTIGVLVALLTPILMGLSRTSLARARIVWTFTLLILGTVLLLSQSRGGIVAAGVSVVVFLWLRPGRSRATLTALVAAFVLVAGLFAYVPMLRPAVVDSLVSRFQGTGGTAGGSGRTVAWRLALDVWQERPVQGWGFGTTEQAFGPRTAAIEHVFHGLHPHNAFLDLLIEVGPIGAMLMVIVLISVIRAGLARPRSHLRAAMMAAVCSGIVLTFVESGLTSAGSIFGFHFWLCAFATTRLRDLEHLPPAEIRSLPRQYPGLTREALGDIAPPLTSKAVLR